MKKNFLIFTGIILLCLTCIQLHYKTPIASEENLSEVEFPDAEPVFTFKMSLDSTAELSPKLQRLLALYISYISTEVDSTCSAIDVDVVRSSNSSVILSLRYVDKKEYREGIYCGASKYDECVIRLWGENINDFWTATQDPVEVQDTNYICPCDDRCSWNIGINMSTQKIIESECFFFCGFPYEVDSLFKLW